MLETQSLWRCQRYRYVLKYRPCCSQPLSGSTWVLILGYGIGYLGGLLFP